MRRIHPEPRADLSDDELRAAYAFPEERPWVRANMVSTLDGAMRGPDGHSRSISGRADRRLLSIARLAADVVLVGAGTIRAEDYWPSRRPIAIVSRRLDLPLSLRLFADRTAEHPRTLILTTETAAGGASPELRAAADLVTCGRDTVDLVTVVEQLNGRGLGHVLCEGGPALLSGIAAAGLLDELLLTVSPLLLGGGPAEHIIDACGGLEPAQRLTLRTVLEDEGTVFLQARRA